MDSSRKPEAVKPETRGRVEAWLRYSETLGISNFYLDRIPKAAAAPVVAASPVSLPVSPPTARLTPPKNLAPPATLPAVVLPVMQAPSLFEAAERVEGDTLERIREDIGECTRCRLHQQRTNIVFGVGNPKAELVFVGEGPGHDEDVQGIEERLRGMVNPVKLVHFTQELNLEYGREAKQLLEELRVLSDKLSLEVYNFLLDKEKAAEYGVDKVPATVVRNAKDYGIRFYGLPAGYEFSTLLDAILAVSKGDSGLRGESKEKLAKVNQPLHLEVFVTPT